jgi:hypothetical protein
LKLIGAFTVIALWLGGFLLGLTWERIRHEREIKNIKLMHHYARKAIADRLLKYEHPNFDDEKIT